MSVELYEEGKVNDICVQDLKDGQIAIVTSQNCKGTIVQRFGEALLTVGKGRGPCWPDLFCLSRLEHFRVRVLPNGSLLKIVDNQ